MKGKFSTLMTVILQLSASLKATGVNLIRVAIFIIFIWIGGLKFWNYEAEGIVPFVANSPFMSFSMPRMHPNTKTTNSKRVNSTQRNTLGTKPIILTHSPKDWA